jgi:hypothetical protein
MTSHCGDFLCSSKSLWYCVDITLTRIKRQAISFEGKLYQQADLRNSIYNEVNGDLSRRCENSLDLAALVALHAVTLLFERSSHRELEIFRIFEQAISILVGLQFRLRNCANKPRSKK